MTVRDPSKNSEMLCKQLKRAFTPNCLTKLETNPKMQDVIDFSDQLLVKQIVLISESELKISTMPKGPTYVFKILEYNNNYKNFSVDLYKAAPFVTLSGKCNYKHIFQNFGKNEPGFQRALHFQIEDKIVHMRHFCTSTEDLEDKFKVCLREIGPRLTLELKEIKEGVFPELKIKKTRYYHKKERNESKRWKK